MARGQAGPGADDILYGQLLGGSGRSAKKASEEPQIDPVTGMRIPEWWPRNRQMDMKQLELSNFYVDVNGCTGSDFVMINGTEIPDGWREASCHGEDAMINSTASTTLADIFINRFEACMIPELEPEAIHDLQIRAIADTDLEITVDGISEWQHREFAEWVRPEQLAAVEHHAPETGNWKFFHSIYDDDVYGLVYIKTDDQLPLLGAVHFGDYHDYGS